MAKDVVSFGSSLHAGLYFLERFCLPRFGKQSVFWEERGLGEFGGKVLVGDQLGLLAQAPRLWLQFWSQPRCRAICGLIPVRKSGKQMCLAGRDKGA